VILNIVIAHEMLSRRIDHEPLTRCTILDLFVTIYPGQDEAAYNILQGLVACGGVKKDELLTDQDFTRVRDHPWFQELLSKCAA